jgi:phosphoribosylglycinamide formyltransferase-1
MTLELGVLISGSGTNLGAILAAVADGRLDARVRLVISNREDAGGLEKARAAGVPTRVISHRQFPTREAFDAEVVAALQGAGVELVVLAGFMRVVTPVLLDAFRDRVVNIHPALLPAFPGVDAQAQAIAYGVRITGCTVHFVDPGVDTGPIIAQAAVEVEPDDDRDRLAKRILEQEHALLVRVLGWLAEGRVQVEALKEGGRRRVMVRKD